MCCIIKILAIDQSTTACGICEIENDKIINFYTKKFKGKFINDRICEVGLWFEKLIQEEKPDVIGLENIQKQGGMQTFQSLANLQGIIFFLSYKNGIEYHIIRPSEWRSTHCIKQGRGIKRKDQKIDTQLWVREEFEIECDEDSADAIGIGWHLYKMSKR